MKRSLKIRRMTMRLLGVASAVGFTAVASCSAGDQSSKPETVQSVTNALSADLVIAEVYGGGKSTNSVYNQDYVVLFNRGSTAVSLNGKFLQYASAAGNFGSGANPPSEPLPNVSVNPGQYFLIAFSTAGTPGANLPTPDHSATVIMNPSGSDGKFALTSALISGCGSTDAGACPTTSIIDLVGYGTASQAETAPTGATDSTHSARRKGGGCIETDNNLLDFEVGAPAPKNTSSTAAPCALADAAVDVQVDVAIDTGTGGATGGTGGATGGTGGATGGTGGATGGTGGAAGAGTGGAAGAGTGGAAGTGTGGTAGSSAGGTGAGGTGGSGATGTGGATGGTGGKKDGGAGTGGIKFDGGTNKGGGSDDDGGCGCATPGSSDHAPRGAALLALLGLAFVARRRRS